MKERIPTVKEAVAYLKKCHTPKYIDDCIAFWVKRGTHPGFEDAVRVGLKKK